MRFCQYYNWLGYQSDKKDEKREYYKKAIAIYTKLDIETETTASIYNGRISSDKKDEEREYYKKAIAIYTKLNRN